VLYLLRVRRLRKWRETFLKIYGRFIDT